MQAGQTIGFMLAVKAVFEFRQGDGKVLEPTIRGEK